MINTRIYDRVNYSKETLKQIKIGDIIKFGYDYGQSTEIVISVNQINDEITTDISKYYITKFISGYGLL